MLRNVDNSLGLSYTCVSCVTIAKQCCLFLPHDAYAGVVSKRVNGSGWCSPQRLPSGIPILYCIIRRFRYLKSKRLGLVPLVPYQIACTPTINFADCSTFLLDYSTYSVVNIFDDCVTCELFADNVQLHCVSKTSHL